MKKLAKNAVTGLYYQYGGTFSAADKAMAYKLEPQEIAFLRATFDNVIEEEIEPKPVAPNFVLVAHEIKVGVDGKVPLTRSTR